MTKKIVEKFKSYPGKGWLDPEERPKINPKDIVWRSQVHRWDTEVRSDNTRMIVVDTKKSGKEKFQMYAVSDKSGEVLFHWGGKPTMDDVHKFREIRKWRQSTKEEVEIEEGAKFSASQINKLKTEYSKLQKIDPESPAYKKMKVALGKMSKEQLKQIKDAKIKFLQYTAGDLLRKMGEEVEIDEEVFYWYIIKGTTQKGKVWRTGTEKEMKLLLRKPTTPSGYVLAKSRKDLSSGAAWKGSMGVSEEVKDTQEFFTLGVNKPTKAQVQDYLNHLGTRLMQVPDIIRTIERYYKTIKNLKLDRSGRKVLSFEEVHMDKKTYNQFMKEAEEYLTGTEEDVDEALSPSQRRRMGLRMRIQAKKPAFIMKRKRMMKRAANKETLLRRARKAAIKSVVKKFYPKLRGKKTSDLSYAERGKISDIVKKKASVIGRFAKRMVKDVRKKDVERRKSMNKKK